MMPSSYYCCLHNNFCFYLMLSKFVFYLQVNLKLPLLMMNGSDCDIGDKIKINHFNASKWINLIPTLCSCRFVCPNIENVCHLIRRRKKASIRGNSIQWRENWRITDYTMSDNFHSIVNVVSCHNMFLMNIWIILCHLSNIRAKKKTNVEHDEWKMCWNGENEKDFLITILICLQNSMCGSTVNGCEFIIKIIQFIWIKIHIDNNQCLCVLSNQQAIAVLHK